MSHFQQICSISVCLCNVQNPWMLSKTMLGLSIYSYSRHQKDDIGCEQHFIVYKLLLCKLAHLAIISKCVRLVIGCTTSPWADSQRQSPTPLFARRWGGRGACPTPLFAQQGACPTPPVCSALRRAGRVSSQPWDRRREEAVCVLPRVVPTSLKRFSVSEFVTVTDRFSMPSIQLEKWSFSFLWKRNSQNVAPAAVGGAARRPEHVRSPRPAPGVSGFASLPPPAPVAELQGREARTSLAREFPGRRGAAGQRGVRGPERAQGHLFAGCVRAEQGWSRPAAWLTCPLRGAGRSTGHRQTERGGRQRGATWWPTAVAGTEREHVE